LEEVDVGEIESSVLNALDGIHDAVGVIDFNDLRRVSIGARTSLAQLQGALGKKLRRTAYVSGRPLFRGVALWIMHRAPDTKARAFDSSARAKAWLGSTEEFHRHQFQKKKAYSAWERYEQRKKNKKADDPEDDT